MRVQAVESATVVEGQRIVLKAEGLVPGAKAEAQVQGQMFGAGDTPRSLDARALAVVVSSDRIELLPPPALFEGGHSTFRGDISVRMQPMQGGAAVTTKVDHVVFDAVSPQDEARAQGRRGELARAFMAAWGMDAQRDDGPGVRVTRVDAHSLAEQAALQVGDRLMTVGGVHVLRVEDLAPAPEGSWSAEVKRGDNSLVLHGPVVVPTLFQKLARAGRALGFYGSLAALCAALAYRTGTRTVARAQRRSLPVALLGTLLSFAAPWLDARATWCLVLLCWGAWSVMALGQRSWGRTRLLRPLVAYGSVALFLLARGGVSLSELTQARGHAPGLLAWAAALMAVVATSFAGRSRPYADIARAWLLAALIAPFSLAGVLAFAAVSVALSLLPRFRAKLPGKWSWRALVSSSSLPSAPAQQAHP